MPRTSLVEIQRRYDITQELATQDEDDTEAGPLATWYNLDVGFLLARCRRLEAALRLCLDAMGERRVTDTSRKESKAMDAARGALLEEKKVDA